MNCKNCLSGMELIHDLNSYNVCIYWCHECGTISSRSNFLRGDGAEISWTPKSVDNTKKLVQELIKELHEDIPMRPIKNAIEDLEV